MFHETDRFDVPFVAGQAGVDIFFVISGFVLWTATAAGTRSPGAFLLDRLIRIAPLYWAVTCLMAACTVLAPFLFPNLVMTPGHLLASLLFIPHPDVNGDTYPLLVPGWTLNYEMFFYAWMAMASGLPRRVQAAALGGVLLAIVASGAALQPANPALRFYAQPIILEFGLGLLLGVMNDRGLLPGRRWSGLLFLIGIVVICVPFASRQVEEAWRLLFWGLPAFVIVFSAVAWEVKGRFICPRIALLLGAASYSTYLLQGFAIGAVTRLLRAHALPVMLALTVVGAAAVGVACYWLVERPMTNALRRLAARVEGRSDRVPKRPPYVVDPALGTDETDPSRASLSAAAPDPFGS